jgi:hypothetical protein
MHLVETYALACGAKIDKPYVYEKYFPLPNTKYISFQPFAGAPIKNYDYWQEVINILDPFLSEKKISILQIGAKNEKTLKGCLSVTGHTNISQAAYIIKRGELHLGADSFGVHVASSYEKKIVSLYSNNLVKNVGPYWSKNEDTALLEPKRKGKPNYSTEEKPKSINSIKPEDIAQSVCELLDIKFKKPYKTIFTGERFGEDDFLVFVPDTVHMVKNPPQPIEVRMDYHFSEEILKKQLMVCPCGIITKKPIDLEILKYYKPHIAHLFYEITKDDKPKFAQAVRKLGIKIIPISRLSEKELSPKKIDYLDVGKINIVEEPDKKLIKKIKKESDLYYKSNKVIMAHEQTFSSHPKYEKHLPTNGSFEPIETTDMFFDDLDHYHIVKKLD